MRRITVYIYEARTWPKFTYDQNSLAKPLLSIKHEQGRLLGRMEALGFQLQEEAFLRTLTQDVLKTSEIEGEILDVDQVRSSLAKRLGMDISGLKPADCHVDGVVEMMLDATKNFKKPLTKKRLWQWHTSLFPEGESGLSRIKVGKWRNDKTGPMQVVSGPIGREKIHFQAPKANRIENEIKLFLDWFETDQESDLILKAAIAHLWFLTIHPFDDGNGRIARAIADLALTRSEKSPRFYSMSAQIRLERKSYYEILERTQKGTLDITPWLGWFLACLTRAVEGAQTTMGGVLRKAQFWESLSKVSINKRQQLVLNQLLDGFEGKLTSSKWAKLAKCSQDTASRDITELIALGILARDAAGGRSTSYSLV
jgi:Fic family protein